MTGATAPPWATRRERCDGAALGDEGVTGATAPPWATRRERCDGTALGDDVTGATGPPWATRRDRSDAPGRRRAPWRPRRECAFRRVGLAGGEHAEVAERARSEREHHDRRAAEGNHVEQRQPEH